MALRLLNALWINFFAVDDDGTLRFYQYRGRGERNRAPGNANWNELSGVPIGRGWDNVKWILPYFGRGEIVILAVRNDGDLLWFGKTGDIVSDPTGSVGWLPNSGNVIGNGFNGVEHLIPWIGTSFDGGSGLLAIEPNGTMRWYYYEGHGEQDPTGTLGWRPNSGNRIGQGWNGFRHLVGPGPTFFGVSQDGILHWYRYTGNGVDDPAGTVGWDANSGNPVGNGWDEVTNLTCSDFNFDSRSYAIYAIQSPGVLRWYEYHGRGENDFTGSLGWDANSGNIISGTW